MAYSLLSLLLLLKILKISGSHGAWYNASDLCLGDSWFASWLGHPLHSEVFFGFHMFLQVQGRMVPPIRL